MKNVMRKVVISHVNGFSRAKLEAGRDELGYCIARYESKSCSWLCFEGLARRSGRFRGVLFVW